ncbi:MAG: hypothetical protein JXD19_02405 [Deltaproteobacteria bacterium]|nr:hypothetical protein [Deltaproteobacteria bacterium]
MKKFEPLSLEGVTTVSLRDRKSKVSVDLFGKPYSPGSTTAAFLNGLPSALGAMDLNAVIDHIVRATENGRTVIFGMGAHVIKVGLAPLIIQLMERGVITGIALNGAGAVHDAEVALEGKTSEDVETELDTGRFGMSEETAAFLNHAVAEGNQQGLGVGGSIGGKIISEKLPFGEFSILARAARLNIPATIHVAIGTDINHLHPSFEPAAWGTASHLDFRLFSSLVSTLEEGVYVNIGSAVLLPEVFLKALTLVRNKGYVVDHIATVNMDFIRHYRPLTNVVSRPTRRGGKGYNLVGHHEIMVPLLAAGIMERLAAR